MRRILAASLLLSPLFFPAAAVQSQPVKDASASTPNQPISTGVTVPTLTHTTDIILSPRLDAEMLDHSKVVLKLNLDEQGKAENIRVVQSVDPTLNSHVVDAVRQFRWIPAKLDNRPVATDMTLSVEILH